MIDENVFYSNETVGYVYKCEMINTLYSNHNISDSFSELFKKINMPANIYIVPKRLDTKKIWKNYKKQIKTVDGYGRLQKRYLKQTQKLVNKYKYYNYDIYIVFLEYHKKGGLEKKERLQIFQNEYQLSSKQIRLLNLINEEMTKKSQTIFGEKFRKSSLKDTKFLFEYLCLPTDEIVQNFVSKPSANHIEYIYEKNGVTKKLYTRSFIVKSFPEKTAGFNIFKEAKNLGIPVEVIVKTEPNLNNFKMQNKIKKQKNLLRKYLQKYKRDNEISDDDYEQANYMANIANNEMKDMDKMIIDTQMIIRLKGDNLETLEKYSEKIVMKFLSEKIQLVSLLGLQQICQKHILPQHNLIANNIHNLDNNYFDFFNLLGGLKIGDDDGIITNYVFQNKKPVLGYEFNPLKGVTNATTANMLYSGVSGSGKSQLANGDIFRLLLFEQAKTLLIDPKGDRKGFSKKIKDAESLINEIVIGSDLKYKGCLDVFKSRDNDSEVLTKLIDIIISLVRASNEIVVKTEHITNAYHEYISKDSTKKCFCDFLEVYKKYDEDIYYNLKALENVQHANLFFGEQASNEFDFSKKFTIIILEKVNLSMTDSFTNKLIKVVMDNVDSITYQFMRKDGIEKKVVAFEEYEYFKNLMNSAEKMVNSMIRLVRGFGGLLKLITQQFSDVSIAILDQMGQFYIGRMKSVSELKLVCEYFDLNFEKFKFLIKKDDQVETEQEKYRFLYVDYNNRKSIVRQQFLDMFQTAFTTHLKRDDVYEKRV